jgi:hypothetical protein
MNSVAEQIAMLRRLAQGAWIPRLRVGLWVLLAGLIIGGLFTAWPPLLMAALFAAVVTWSAERTSPHIRNAALASYVTQYENGEISISITPWSDSQSYHASVATKDSGSWRFEFIPQGWDPKEGPNSAKLYFIKGTAWPALIVLPDGILYPRDVPENI